MVILNYEEKLKLDNISYYGISTRVKEFERCIMARYEILSQGKVVKFDDPSKFLNTVESFIQIQQKFIIIIVKAAVEVVDEVNNILEKYGIKVEITEDSNPKAVDYIANALLGAGIGAGVGAILGGAFATYGSVLAKTISLDIVFPGLSQCIAIGAGIGAVIGAIGGVQATTWGLKIKFTPIYRIRRGLKLEFLPPAEYQPVESNA